MAASLSSIVIKVKYGETFRRFSASIDEDKKIALDIVTLREKIRSLFSFGSDIDYTYVDEDGDEVTLVDDYDLHDVVPQSPSPFRITVKLNNNNGSPGTGTNVLFDSLKLHQSHSHQFQNLNFAGATSSSTPGVAKLAEKMQAESLNQISGSMGGLRMQTPTGGASNVDGQLQDVSFELVPKAPSSSPMVTEVIKQRTADSDQISASMASQKVHTPTGGSLNVNSELSTLNDNRISVNCEAEISNSKKTDKQVQKVTNGMTSSRKDLGLNSHNLNLPPIMKNPELVNQNDLMDSAGNILIKVPDPEAASADSDPIDQDTGVPNDSVISGNGEVSSTMATRSPAEVAAMSSFSDSTEVETASTSLPVGPVVSLGFYPSLGLHPKSIRSPTMDFSVMSSRLVRGAPPPTRIPVVQPSDSNNQEVSVPVLQDVSSELVPEAPSSSLMVTEVIKQRTAVYSDQISTSVASQKVHTPTSGSSDVNSELSTLTDSRISVNCEAESSNSEKTDKQVQKVTKGMTSYTKDLGLNSHNLNLLPIMKNPELVNQNDLMDSAVNILIKVPDPEAASADSDPIDQDTGFPNDSVISDNGEASSTMATRSPAEVAAMSSFSDSTEVETASTSLPVGPVVSSGFYPSLGLHPESIRSPTMDFSVMSSRLVRGAPPPTRIPVVQPSDSTNQEVSVPSDDKAEQKLLKYLEKIGFKKLDLNRKILRMNNYDLEKSIDDLCCALEWEPMLENLQEMGFVDEKTNRKLLEKNDGSITLTVMDLINEKALNPTRT